jgi:hypothetical protein
MRSRKLPPQRHRAPPPAWRIPTASNTRQEHLAFNAAEHLAFNAAEHHRRRRGFDPIWI